MSEFEASLNYRGSSRTRTQTISFLSHFVKDDSQSLHCLFAVQGQAIGQS